MIRPLRDVLVLEPLEKPGMVGLLHIPDNQRLDNKTGGECRVLAAGPDCVLAKKGDRVHVTAYGSQFAGEPFDHDGKKITLLRERDINGVIQESGEPWCIIHKRVATHVDGKGRLCCNPRLGGILMSCEVV